MEGLNYMYLPLRFNRSKNIDSTLKTYLWVLLAPLLTAYVQRKFDIGLIYCDDSVPYYGFIIKLLARRAKVVIRLGDLQSGYAFADKHPLLFKLALKIEVSMWRKVDGIVAISEPFKEFIINQGIDKNKVKVVKECIDIGELDLVDCDVKYTGIIMFHGALVKCKGLEVLIDAFNMIRKDYPGLKLMIAGGGSEEKNIKKYVIKNNVNNVDFTGWYDHCKLKNLMNNVQIGVAMRSPNIANNFVVTTCLLENWVYRKPVIVPDLDAFNDEVADGVNGIFYRAGDAKDLYKKLKYLYTNPNLYGKLVKNGMDSAKKVFDHKKIANDMCISVLQFVDKD